jgi:pimeloyl-ACP methyl ester carboxylesterase
VRDAVGPHRRDAALRRERRLAARPVGQTLARFGDKLRRVKPTVQRFGVAVRGSSMAVRRSPHARQLLRAASRRRALARCRPCGHGPAPDLAALAQPTLVVDGSRDTMILPGAGAWLAEHLPDAKCVTISGAGHAPFLSHPEAFAAAVEAFLDGR